MNKRKIVLEDGAVFTGNGFGSLENKMVEIVFNTSMVGYQEILSDPSYTDQAVVMTYPLIGNYGMCAEDYECLSPSVSGMIVREYCYEPSNFRADKTLEEVMIAYGIVGVSGIDTRKLGRHIRDVGTCKAYICQESVDDSAAVQALADWIPATDQVARVSTPVVYRSAYTKEESPVMRKLAGFTDKTQEETAACPVHVVAIDCGMKLNILRSLERRGCEVTVVPWNTSADEILALKPDGLFISNGPGDPQSVGETVQAVKALRGKLPIFGICLGHQIIARAYGADTYKLKFGHRGGNHPVKNLLTGKVEITSQNHSYAVDEESLKGTGLDVTHRNLLDQTIEGLCCRAQKVFSVQYHPESAPGPQDSAYLFDQFVEMMKAEIEKHAAQKADCCQADAAKLGKEGKEDA